MTIPASVKIGHLTYTVEVTAAADLGENDADIDHGGLVIRISADMAPAVQAEKLMHEVLHGCYDSFKIGPRWGEEKVVTALAPALCAWLQDNRELVKWIQDGGKP